MKEYISQLQDYVNQHQMELVPLPEWNNPSAYYMPHHAVIKESSTTTKVRVVFDASAKSSTGISLNDLMYAGPVVQDKLLDHLVRFRLHKICFIADIEKMYRQISLNKEDRDYCRILWRTNPEERIQMYRMTSLPFGTAAAPYLACRTLLQVAMDEKENCPLAATAVNKSFYMDDIMDGAPDVKTAIVVKDQLSHMLNGAYFSLRKWNSNSKEFLQTIPPDFRGDMKDMLLDESDTVKTLGLLYSPSADTFEFRVTKEELKIFTKRTLLSYISKIFDPLGWLSPTIITAKIFMQELWSRKLEWDAPLPADIVRSWNEYASQLLKIEEIRIPRYLNYTPTTGQYELHGFSDASGKAYSAAVYLRCIRGRKVFSHLVVAKTRVAPLKTITLPRLELLGAHLVAELMNYVESVFDITISSKRYWTDSSIVLHWIHTEPSKLKTFVGNRVAQIQNLSTPSQWAHVISEDNPADCASRGIFPNELKNHPLWWTGPPWLSQQILEIPTFVSTLKCTDEDKKPTAALMVKMDWDDEHYIIELLDGMSRWSKIIKTMALILRVLEVKSFKVNPHQMLSPREWQRAENKVIHLLQKATYANVYKCVEEKRTKAIRNKQFRSLDLFLDDDLLLRVGGRLENAELDYNAKHPILLPGYHHIVVLLIMRTHNNLAHAGAGTVLNHLRQKYWIVGGKRSIKSVINNCILCFRYNAKQMTQIMANLPACRVRQSRPFLFSGVDLCGPYNLRNFCGNRNSRFKVWICIFTCMATRAIHVEVVTSLSYECFLLALRRFMARRGRPSDLYSDNGTNFVGANNFLIAQSGLQEIVNKVLPDMELEKINWHFSPPRTPHMGGVWESCVKLIKTYLQKLLSDDSYTYEEFLTILTFVEGLVNSRPLMPLSEDVEDLEALTPAHFLVGNSLTWIPESDLTHLKLNQLDKYQLVQRRSAEVWKRWQEEYLQTLQKKQKWTEAQENLKVGDLVLIAADDNPPLAWKLGRVQATHPGKDGKVRVVTLETEGSYQVKKGKTEKVSKEFVRPIHKLVKLPTVKDDPEPDEDADPKPDNDPKLQEDLSKLEEETGVYAITPSSSQEIRNAALIFRSQPSPQFWIQTLLCVAYIIQHTTASNTETLEIASLKNTLNWTPNYTMALYAYILAIIGTLGHFLALLTLIATPVLRKKKATWFVMALNASDLFFSLVNLPLLIWENLEPEHFQTSTWCQIRPFLFYGNIASTILLLMFITLNRYFKICLTEFYEDTYTRKRTLAMIGLSFIIGFSFMIPSLIGFWGRLGRRDGSIPMCTILPLKDADSPKRILFSLAVGVPAVIITVSYINILLKVRKSGRAVQRHRNITNLTMYMGIHPSDLRLFRTITVILGSFAICFFPSMAITLIDPERRFLPLWVYFTATALTWTEGFLHVLIYILMNRNYREAFTKLWARGQVMIRSCSGSAVDLNAVQPRSRTNSERSDQQHQVNLSTSRQQRIPATPHHSRENSDSEDPPPLPRRKPYSMIATTVLVLAILFGVTSTTEVTNGTRLRTFPLCEIPWNPHHEIPECAKAVHWLHILANGTICRRERVCDDTFVVTPEGRGCRKANDCEVFSEHDLDELKCQDAQLTQNLELLEKPEVKSHLCAVGDYVIKHCRHFKEEIKLLPIATYKTKVYPLASLNTKSRVYLDKISSYTCEGKCQEINCQTHRCTGDAIFCSHFHCDPEAKNILPSQVCNCLYNDQSEVFVVQTDDGEVIPQCLGHLQAITRKEDRSRTKDEYDCHDCEVECTRTGVRVTTPGKVPRYVKAQKNPAYVSINPTSETSDLEFTVNMLSSAGNIHIEIWIAEFDTPSKMEVKCPRSSICDLITCHFCLQKWMNVSCYNTYHYIILSALGVCLSALLIVIMFTTKVIYWISWYLCCPLRKYLQYRVRRRERMERRHSVLENIATAEEMEMETPNPYYSVLYPDSENRRPSLRKSKIIRLSTATATIIGILFLLPFCSGCSQFSAMTTSSRECHTTDEATVKCSIRLNARLALSPLEQQSCFRIEDTHGSLLGTITLKTKSVSVKCLKRLLYYVPAPKLKCSSAVQCYNLYSTAQCHGSKCKDIQLNGTIKEFEHSSSQLGWTYCQQVRISSCLLPWTSDCIFYRMFLENPTNQGYSVSDCPEWTNSVKLEVMIHMGEKRTTKEVTLYAGSIVTEDNIQFSLVSTSTPPTPILNECLISIGGQYALSPCNLRQEYAPNRLGEIQCNTLKDAQELNKNCLANINLIRAITDSNGVKCVGDLINPQKLMKIRSLPLKLEDGVLTIENNSVVFEASRNSLLEVQLSTENYQLTKQVQETTCNAEFIRLSGCYGCSQGCVASIQAQSSHGETLASLRCNEIGFFTPVHLTQESRTNHIIMKLDQPDIDVNCELVCDRNTVKLKLKGHLQYLANSDSRESQSSISYEPVNLDSGFNFASILGVSLYDWIVRGCIAIFVIICACFFTGVTLKIVAKKLV